MDISQHFNQLSTLQTKLASLISSSLWGILSKESGSNRPTLSVIGSRISRVETFQGSSRIPLPPRYRDLGKELFNTWFITIHQRFSPPTNENCWETNRRHKKRCRSLANNFNLDLPLASVSSALTNPRRQSLGYIMRLAFTIWFFSSGRGVWQNLKH